MARGPWTLGRARKADEEEEMVAGAGQRAAPVTLAQHQALCFPISYDCHMAVGFGFRPFRPPGKAVGRTCIGSLVHLKRHRQPPACMPCPRTDTLHTPHLSTHENES